MEEEEVSIVHLVWRGRRRRWRGRRSVLYTWCRRKEEEEEEEEEEVNIAHLVWGGKRGRGRRSVLYTWCREEGGGGGGGGGGQYCTLVVERKEEEEVNTVHLVLAENMEESAVESRLSRPLGWPGCCLTCG